MDFKNLEKFWWIAAESKELKKNNIVKRRILNRDVVLFKQSDGEIIALKDQCIHRGARLSEGWLDGGELTCPYHGWKYSTGGKVVDVPSEEKPLKGHRCQKSYTVVERDDYVYINFQQTNDKRQPFKMPHYKDKGYLTIRLQNLFEGQLLNCVENFVDIPHTTYVHPNIFRNESNCKTKIHIKSSFGHVFVDYENENSDFGWFSWFLNPNKEPVIHTDEYYGPNITTVNYHLTRGHFIITSQCIPVDSDHTLVYTDLTYNYGLWNRIAKPLIKIQGQKIIDQDVVILRNQHQSLKKNPMRFQNTNHDLIHTSIDRVFNEFVKDPISESNKPAAKNRVDECSFWV